jgi:hypothetical protein
VRWRLRASLAENPSFLEQKENAPAKDAVFRLEMAYSSEFWKITILLGKPRAPKTDIPLPSAFSPNLKGGRAKKRQIFWRSGV